MPISKSNWDFCLHDIDIYVGETCYSFSLKEHASKFQNRVPTCLLYNHKKSIQEWDRVRHDNPKMYSKPMWNSTPLKYGFSQCKFSVYGFCLNWLVG